MRIWFNHWFSTAYHFINALKENGHYVIATNERDTCVYKINSDEFYIEPVFDNEEEYFRWALKFCMDYHIDVFFVKRNMKIINSTRLFFDRIGTKVICEDSPQLYQLMNNKKNSADFLECFNVCKIPEMIRVNRKRDFAYAYEHLSKKHEKVCIKYNEDEGGQSFKLIQDRKPSMDRISENNGLVYSYDYIMQCMTMGVAFKPLLVMPYLEGPEVSIDCLNTSKGFIAVPRQKLSNRVTRIDMDEKLINIAHKIQDALKCTAPYNIQLRKHNGEWYFLETNARLSGGAWKAKYNGIDFVNTVVDDISGNLKELPKPIQKQMDLSNIENVVIL